MKKNLIGLSMLTIVFLYMFLSIVLFGIALIFDFPLTSAIVVSIVVLILQFLIAPFISDITYKLFYKAKFNYELPDYLNKFIDEICSKYNMKRPKIGFIDDGTPNACCYGRGKNSTRIIITRGVLDLLDEEEVKTVVGHEFGHAIHYDMLFMTVAELVPQIFYLIYSITTDSNNSNKKNNKGGGEIGLIAYICYIISQFIVLWLSRTREYYADRFSVEETRNPNALASALVKIGFGLVAKSEAKHPSKNFGAKGIFDAKTSKSLIVTTNNSNDKESIKNAMKWDMWNIWAKLYELNSTHPLISKRILKISDYSKEFGQEPYIVFDLVKPESYVDDFIVDLVINYFPALVIIIGIITGFLYFAMYETCSLLLVGVFGIALSIACYIKLLRSHPNKGFQETNIKELLGEVKVSGITSVPCILKGKTIGKGTPGYILSEDYTLRDETGIIFLNYNQPLGIMNLYHALFKNNQNQEKEVVVKGWYRRSPVPYIEMLTMDVEGKTHKIHNVLVKKIFIAILLLISIFLLFI